MSPGELYDLLETGQIGLLFFQSLVDRLEKGSEQRIVEILYRGTFCIHAQTFIE
jgi:hypothetical protein